MWIVKTINRDNITDIVEYVQEISKINDKDIEKARIFNSIVNTKNKKLTLTKVI